ncbi:MAG: hypothetical protein WA764_05065, partial [Pseudolabrys sp.]
GFCSTSLDQSSALQTEAVTTRCRRVKIDREARRDSFRRARLYDRRRGGGLLGYGHKLPPYLLRTRIACVSPGM